MLLNLFFSLETVYSVIRNCLDGANMKSGICECIQKLKFLYESTNKKKYVTLIFLSRDCIICDKDLPGWSQYEVCHLTRYLKFENFMIIYYKNNLL